MAAATPQLGALRLTIVVAASARNGIGAKGALPWRLPKDMAYFRAVTCAAADVSADDDAMRRAGWTRSAAPVKNAVIMGRNTWESIPARFRPLAGRINVVVSSTMQTEELGLYVASERADARRAPDADTVVVRSFEDAVALLQERRCRQYTRDGCAPPPGAALGRAFVIGGAALYRYVLAHTPGADWSLNDLLVTRLYAAHLDDACDVFLDEFRTPAQRAFDDARVRQCVDKGALPTDVDVCAPDGDAVWRQVDVEEHRAYFRHHAALGERVGPVFDDNGTAVQFQLWKRLGSGGGGLGRI
ncbi:dihydrofolate reductase [Malassezia sp. CBS 17886]|nr:dihydrofolate reductase [Malassezia sp. CBS 17886]